MYHISYFGEGVNMDLSEEPYLKMDGSEYTTSDY